MSFTITIAKNVFTKEFKFKENEWVDWSKKNLKEQSEAERVIDLAAELGIEPKSIFKYLKVNLGELVKPNQVLAEKSGFLGSKKVLAPQPAEVRRINHENGTLTLAIKQLQDVPFRFKAKFIKQDAQNQLLFKVSGGTEIALQNSLENTFGGECVYLQKPSEITLKNCEGKIAVFEKLDMMAQAKLAALGPLATISYEITYHNPTVALLLLAEKNAFTELIAKNWPLSLYLADKKTIYFYQP